ncbi:WD40 repeat domain-containing protein [Rhodocytophaga aerolata]|uniref:WD40 repeat domain-containing protein n=1 Tax=Rhodocytophaga aerolata TaxID=455078 RepID=A0ABT8RHY2_9BACT|nr:WD40 repeat domain-containing protein [Rhodocytophaga aerolata]MDO1451711.1 WD40 repeat domain-containing protein [Rhodocytophaga aerolata]
MDFPHNVGDRRSLNHQNAVTSAVFGEGGQRVLTASGGLLRFWDVASLKQIGSAINLNVYAQQADLSPDGEYILTVDSYGRSDLWQASTGHPIVTLIGNSTDVTHATFSPDGKSIVTANKDNTAHIWHIGADLDLPPDLLKIQAKAITGLELDLNSNEVNYLPARRWYDIKAEYFTKARNHFRVCKYREYNLWRRFSPEEAKRIFGK